MYIRCSILWGIAGTEPLGLWGGQLNGQACGLKLWSCFVQSGRKDNLVVGAPNPKRQGRTEERIHFGFVRVASYEDRGALPLVWGHEESKAHSDIPRPHLNEA